MIGSLGPQQLANVKKAEGLLIQEPFGFFCVMAAM